MTTHTRNGTVRGFTLYRIVSRFSFYIPIFVVALLAARFDYRSIGLLLFLYGLATTLFGGWASRLMARRGPGFVIAAGEAMKACGNALIAVVLGGALTGEPAGAGLALLAAAQVIGGIGYSFAAIADGSFLSLAGPVLGVTKEQEKAAQARSSSLMFLSFLIAGIVGAVAYQHSPALPFLMTVAANICAGLLSLTLLAPVVGASARTAREGLGAGQGEASWPGAAMAMKMSTYALLRAMVLVVQILILPVWFFLILKIQIPYFGLLFALYTFAGFVGGRLYPRIHRLAGETAGQTSIVLICAATLFLVAFSAGGLILVLLPTGFFFVAGMLRPAFLPTLSSAPTAGGAMRNLVPPSERLFGILSSVIYLAVAAAFGRALAPQQIMFAAACLVTAYSVLSTLANMTRART